MVRVLLILGTTLLGLFLDSPATAFVFNYSNYLSKLIAPRPEEQDYNYFANHYCKDHPRVQLWLENLEQELNDLGMNYDADLSLVFDLDGSIKYINLERIKEDDPVKFKNFISRLSNLQTKILPKELADSIFDLDAKWLYIDRPKIISEKLIRHPILENLTRLPELISARLVEPSFIDYPIIGQAVLLQLKQSPIMLDSRIIHFDNDSIDLDVYKILDMEKNTINLFRHQLVLRINKNNSREILGSVVASGLNLASQAGLGESFATYGILPAGLAVLGMGAAVLNNREKLVSFALSKGDELELVRLANKS